jgi:hypothetical protein
MPGLPAPARRRRGAGSRAPRAPRRRPPPPRGRLACRSPAATRAREEPVDADRGEDDGHGGEGSDEGGAEGSAADCATPPALGHDLDRQGSIEPLDRGPDGRRARGTGTRLHDEVHRGGGNLSGGHVPVPEQAAGEAGDLRRLLRFGRSQARRQNRLQRGLRVGPPALRQRQSARGSGVRRRGASPSPGRPSP